MKQLYLKLDQIIEDLKKTKQVVLFLESKGLLDPDVVALWEIEETNKNKIFCTHANEDGTSALATVAGLTECRKCGADDIMGDF